jgi:hypothetical protein
MFPVTKAITLALGSKNRYRWLLILDSSDRATHLYRVPSIRIGGNVPPVICPHGVHTENILFLSFVREVSGGKGVQIACEEHRLKTRCWRRPGRRLEKARQEKAGEGKTGSWRRPDRSWGRQNAL